MTEKQFANLTVRIWRLRQQLTNLALALKATQKRLAQFKRAGMHSPAHESWLKSYPTFHDPIQRELEGLCRKLAA